MKTRQGIKVMPILFEDIKKSSRIHKTDDEIQLEAWKEANCVIKSKNMLETYPDHSFELELTEVGYVIYACPNN